MSKNELITVIIPVYKVEKYLERCVRSVMSQTYTHLEIILVDDGSPDDCGKMCDAFALEDARIKVIHKENGGLSDARNYGVEIATGEYIAFIDSDDYVSEEYIEYLYDLLTKNNSDISCCCHIKTNETVVEYGVNEKLPEVQTLTGLDACKRMHEDLLGIIVVAWAKLCKTDIVKKHKFPVGRIHEDEATTFKFFYDSKMLVVGNRQLYVYYSRPDSIMGAIKSGVNKDAIWAIEHRGSYFEQFGEWNLAEYIWDSLFRYCVEESMLHGGIYDKYLKNFRDGKRMAKNTSFCLSLYNIHPSLYKAYIWRNSLPNVIKRKFLKK